jgi:glycosyltransferase involved in cell wall biosynthesis
MKEITVFANGDSSKIRIWSNVPFFFTETFISKGIKVNRIDLSPSILLETIFNITCYPLIKVINRKTSYEYFRSLIHFINVRNRIRKAIKKYSNSDAYIFLTFSFSSAGLTSKPTIQFSDWTYNHYFNYFKNRKPDFFERRCIKRENSQIEGSNLVLTLFPSVAEYMKERYKNSNIFYLGNVINSLLDVSEEEILNLKENSYNLLFVGRKKYIEGAQSLIIAFENLKVKYPQLSLHIIGMKTSDFKNLPKDVYCYGYLDKGDDNDRELYYKLFREAKIFVNTTPKWGAFSASIEAMYFYTPVIISPYKEFIKTFGRNIDFGCYCEPPSLTCLEEKIMNIFNNSAYKMLCRKAHDSVKEYTWDAYIDKVISKIEEILIPAAL